MTDDNLEERMLDKLEEIKKARLIALQSVKDETELDAWRVAYLGRNSPLMQIFNGLSTLSPQERPKVGHEANSVRMVLEGVLKEKKEAIKYSALAKSLEEDSLDVTLPGRSMHIGPFHSLTPTTIP